MGDNIANTLGKTVSDGIGGQGGNVGTRTWIPRTGGGGGGGGGYGGGGGGCGTGYIGDGGSGTGNGYGGNGYQGIVIIRNAREAAV